MQTTPRPTVTVLIAARNEEAALPATLASLAQQTLCPEAVIVVDDGSSDSTAETAEAWGAEVIRLPSSRGSKSAAQDAALASITTDLIVTVDADTELAPDALERLTAPFAEADPPGAACGFILPRRTRSLWERGRLVEYLFGQVFYKTVQSDCRAVLVTAGCLACYPAALIRERGGFRSRLLAEDMDVTTWITTSGGRWGASRRGAVFVRDAYAYTIDPPDFRRYRGQLLRWYSGFFQNARLHARALLACRNPLVSLFILSTFIDALLAVGMQFALPVFGVWRHWRWERWVTVSLLALAGELLLVGAVASVGALGVWRRRARLPDSPGGEARASYGGSRRRLVTTVALSLPCYLLTSIVNRFIFFVAFAREMLGPLVGIRPLATWNRGR